ncbi:HK97 gp10 family phage protein [Haloterrigena sp. SYSU A558-1]|uniref:HK97 gp10 family phage protein n=1 Tax=Haloterrigena gelatinilytica TaxID=2741724 RepID=A0ABX2LD02_9EURY|nr:HK97-gp10 family putative phage morphogenesis protein [Haloterrigena gelatinilytica]NUC71706.1 HK97 gp10 family phage protein [Haloterrigena gelatinilytica]
MISFNWKSGQGPDALVEDLETFKDEFFGRLEDDVETTVDEAVEEAQSRARVDTGELRDSIRNKVEQMTGKIVAHLIAGAEHSAYNEFGTIYMSAQPMIRPALRKVEQDLVDRITKSWDQAARAL